MSESRRVEYIALSKLEGATSNPKLHADNEIKASMERFGFVETPVIDERTGRLVAGHGRRDALRSLKATGRGAPTGVRVEHDDWYIPVERGWSSKDDAEADAYLVSSNRTTELGGWDEAALATMLSDVRGWDEAALATMLSDVRDTGAGLEGVGFTNQELDKMLAAIAQPKPGNTDPDDAPEPEEESYVKPGELWHLGAHRILCGDSTNANDLARLLDGARADLCLTDPPYGIGESYESHDDTQENLRHMVDGFFGQARAASDVVLLTPGNVNQRHYPKPEWTLAWFVPAGTGSGPWGFSCWQPVLAYGKDPYLAAGKGCRPDALVMTESADNTLAHPCPKPVGVWSWLMERGSLDGALILDPFSGSGTSIIAAEKTGRRCCAIEIEPKYVQVAIERWQNVTGKKAERANV